MKSIFIGDWIYTFIGDCILHELLQVLPEAALKGALKNNVLRILGHNK